MSPITIPKVYNFGAGELAELSYLEDVLGISRKAARAWLKALHIEPLFIGSEVFFSLPTFKSIMYVLSKPGGKGFAFPGSLYRKNDPRLKEVTPEILAMAKDPMTAVEMEIAQSHDSTLMRKLLDYKSKMEKPSAGKKESPDGE